MDHMSAEIRVYSPRWGQEDTYVLQLSRDSLVISHGPSETTCTYRENLDPEWSGDSLERILMNDAVYPPSVLPRLLEHAWLAWRANEINASSLQEELNAVAEWINTSTRAKPQTEFWRRYF
jgi:hypothetical protein